MTHREIKPCSGCAGVVVTVNLRGATYEVCGDMNCDLARAPKDAGERAVELVRMHNELRTQRLVSTGRKSSAAR